MKRNAKQKATLDEFTLWRISLRLQKEGFKDSSASIRVRFVEARGYEPPQGRVFVEDDYNGFINTDDNGYSGAWSLSEDKNDRKDGLWVWGLFEEPKYPFLYFSLDVFNSTIAASGEEEPLFDGLGIPNNRLNIRFSHSRDQEEGVKLESGEISYQEIEYMKADLLGVGGEVNVGDIVDAGKIDIRAVFD
eukprot:CAMPEP_0182429944 /NCGR_PEP_ID=MMETSP1167-20130531/35326_1 /TAXON_ID=2988 /ORGANISM="Mallomonas Sp, Strain CCMP3275" /LENGTH=189 /DNA_ID=CAMNT_0024614373 /DNA_START=103 /DNA_END=672 /DNA_ORIENTATION=+